VQTNSKDTVQLVRKSCSKKKNKESTGL